jgi:large subunit ribosomal protein L28
MSKTCAICAKGPMSGNAVSHSNRKTRRSWKPNTQRVRIIVGGGVRSMNVCTRCLRGNKIQRAL